MAPPVERPVRPRQQVRPHRIGNRATATLLRRLHGASKSGQPVRERRSHKLTYERTDEERWSRLARSACTGFVAWWPEER